MCVKDLRSMKSGPNILIFAGDSGYAYSLLVCTH